MISKYESNKSKRTRKSRKRRKCNKTLWDNKGNSGKPRDRKIQFWCQRKMGEGWTQPVQPSPISMVPVRPM